MLVAPVAVAVGLVQSVYFEFSQQYNTCDQQHTLITVSTTQTIDNGRWLFLGFLLRLLVAFFRMQSSNPQKAVALVKYKHEACPVVYTCLIGLGTGDLQCKSEVHNAPPFKIPPNNRLSCRPKVAGPLFEALCMISVIATVIVWYCYCYCDYQIINKDLYDNSNASYETITVRVFVYCNDDKDAHCESSAKAWRSSDGSTR